VIPKYYVVLFKNKVRKKIIKKFSNLKSAEKFFENQIKLSEDIIFDKTFENGKESSYEIALLQNNENSLDEVYLKDEFGRNIKVVLEDDQYEMMKIRKYRLEEKIYDVKKQSKISVDQLIKTYLKGDGVKMVSTLNNKFVIQKDTDLFLFSLKSEDESKRFIDCISGYFYRIGRKDCLFVKDTSSPQKKYLYEQLSNSGIDKKILYRKFTTFPRE
jgi:hypothetical protein